MTELHRHVLDFNYQGHPVRTVLINGEPWWVAKDVCAALDLSGDPGQHLRRLDPDEKGLSIIQTPGGTQETLIINEPGLYALILTSRKPEAKRFKRWITHEVLPAIRKTGTYSVSSRNRSVTLSQDQLKALLDDVADRAARATAEAILPLNQATLRSSPEDEYLMPAFVPKRMPGDREIHGFCELIRPLGVIFTYDQLLLALSHHRKTVVDWLFNGAVMAGAIIPTAIPGGFGELPQICLYVNRHAYERLALPTAGVNGQIQPRRRW